MPRRIQHILDPQRGGAARSAAAPAAPAWSSIVSTNVQNTLNWNSVVDATGYNVWRGPTRNGPWLLLSSNQSGTTYNDTTATAGVMYAYHVTATGPTGTSARSAIRQAMRAVIQTLTIDGGAIEDTRLTSGTPATNNGASATLAATGEGASSGSRTVTALRVPLASLPSGAVVTSATLSLWVNTTDAAAHTFIFYELAAGNLAWGELTATWNTRDGSAAWLGGATGASTAGVDYINTALGTMAYSAGAVTDTELTATLTPSVVQAKATGNLDLVMRKTGSTLTSTPTLRSSESSSANKPRLTVQYYVPWSDTEATRYLASGGSDAANGLTSGTAWATLAYALQQLTPGSTLIVADGTYAGAQLASGATQSGTASKPIVVRAEDGARPWITGALKVNDAHYWRFERISVNGSDVAYTGTIDELVLLRNSNYWTWTRGELKSKATPNTQASGSTGGFKALIAMTGTNPSITYSHIHHNPGLNPSETADGDGNAIYQDHLIYVSGGSGAIIEHNRLHDAPNGRAVKVGASNGANPDPTNTTIRNNTIWGCPGPDPIRYSFGTTGNVVEYNIIGGPTVNDGSGAGIISTHSPDGAGTMATVANTWAWDASGGSTAMVGASQTNIVELSGNQFGTDPQLDVNDAPGHAGLFSGGVYVAGHLRGLSSATDWPG